MKTITSLAELKAFSLYKKIYINVPPVGFVKIPRRCLFNASVFFPFTEGGWHVVYNSEDGKSIRISSFVPKPLKPA